MSPLLDEARRRPAALLGAILGALLAAIAFDAGGATILARTTRVEVALTLAGGLVLALAALRGREPDNRGLAAVVGVWALAALTAMSLAWSVSPSESWLEANRTFAYAMVFTVAVVGARTMASRWASVLGGLLAAGAAICVYALLTKIFPGALDASDVYARLRAPFGYWNAVGLSAALTVIPCLWLGSRRGGSPIVTALAYPLTGTAMVVMMLSYSRGALVALALGCAVWLWLGGRRVRSAAVLLVAASGAAPVVAWAFSRAALTNDRVDTAARAGAGHELGLLMLAVVALLLVAGLATGFIAQRRPLSVARRDQVGLALVVALALVPVGIAGGLALSNRGLGGSISHAWTKLTDPHAKTPPNTPSRLTGVASVRAQYWNEALNAFQSRPSVGVGAGGFVVARERYRYGNLTVRHAHGFIVQTLADLGLVGLTVILCALALWWRAARASLHARGEEHDGLLCLLACVVAFGAHSAIDWTWAIPGNACAALVCAGWLAGSAGGPGSALFAFHEGSRWRRPVALGRLGVYPAVRVVAALTALLAALSVAWSQLAPQRAADSANAALLALARHDFKGAGADAREASAIDPVGVDQLFDLAAIQAAAGDVAGARAALNGAVRRQPGNAQTWLRLGSFELDPLHNPSAALADFQAALYLDPHNADVIDGFLAADRMLTTTTTTTAAP